MQRGWEEQVQVRCYFLGSAPCEYSVRWVTRTGVCVSSCHLCSSSGTSMSIQPVVSRVLWERDSLVTLFPAEEGKDQAGCGNP